MGRPLPATACPGVETEEDESREREESMRKVLLTVLAVVVAAGAWAQPSGFEESELTLSILPITEIAAGPEQPHQVPRPKEIVARFLAFTQEQVTQWDALIETLQTTVRPLVEQIVANDRQLAELLKQPSPDPAAIGNLILANRGLREDIREAHEVYLTAFEALLTAPQKEKLGFVRRAERVQPIIPAFKVLGLIPPPAPVQPE